MAALGMAITLTCGFALGLWLVLRLREALPWYLAAITFLPVVAMGGLSFRVEHLLTPVLLVAVLLRFSRTPTPRSVPLLAFVAAAWVGFGTLAALMSPVTEGGLAMGVYGIVRPFLWLSLGLLAWHVSDFERLVRAWVATTAAVAALVLMQVAQVGVIRRISAVWYESAARTAGDLIAAAELAGFFARPMATFENVSYAGSVLLLGVATAAWWLTWPETTGRDRRLAIAAIFLGLAAGVATVSATFLAGAPLAVVLAVLLGQRRVSPAALVRLVAGAAFLALALLVVALPLLERVGGSATLQAQWERASTIAIFANRYFSGEGVMADAIAAIWDRPLLGWGVLAGPDPFYSDSLYVFVAYTTGLVGSALFAAVLAGVVVVAHRGWTPKVGRLATLWVAVLLLGGLGAPTLFVPRLMEWWWALAGMVIGTAGLATAAGESRRLNAPSPIRPAPVTDLAAEGGLT